RPQIDDVPLLAAPRSEAVEYVVVQIDAEGATAAVAAMDRARPAALRSAAAQAGPQPQVLQDPGHRQLALQMGKVDAGSLANLLRGRYSGDTGCGDHFSRRLRRRLVARSLACCSSGRTGWRRAVCRLVVCPRPRLLPGIVPRA